MVDTTPANLAVSAGFASCFANRCTRSGSRSNDGTARFGKRFPFRVPIPVGVIPCRLVVSVPKRGIAGTTNPRGFARTDFAFQNSTVTCSAPWSRIQKPPLCGCRNRGRHGIIRTRTSILFRSEPSIWQPILSELSQIWYRKLALTRRAVTAFLAERRSFGSFKGCSGNERCGTRAKGAGGRWRGVGGDRSGVLATDLQSRLQVYV